MGNLAPFFFLCSFFFSSFSSSSSSVPCCTQYSYHVRRPPKGLCSKLATELPENIGDCSGAGVDRTGLSLWALIGLGKSWARIGLDWRLDYVMNLQVLLSWRVRFVPPLFFFFGKFKYADSMMMRFADYQRE
jgi:hypothetical protein